MLVFFFSFSNPFQNILFKLQIQINFILNFSQTFIIFLKVTQTTKNHAKPNNDAQPLVVSILIKLSLIF
jgi:glycerol uptake facilitator-like aquaporin